MDFTVFERHDNAGAPRPLSRAVRALLRRLAIALFLVFAVGVSACDRNPAAQSSPDSGPAPQAAAKSADTPSSRHEQPAADPPSLVTSDELPDQPERIVSLAPNITEILFAVGAGEKVVAVTRFCDYPPAADTLPSVGGMVATDLEAVLSHKPDLVIGPISGGDPEFAQKLDQAGLSYAFLRMKDLEETYRGIHEIGQLVGQSNQAAKVVDTMKERIADSSADTPADRRPTVLLVYGRDPLVAAGPATFGHQLIELAGGHNVLADTKTAYPKLDVEKVIELDPARIIDASEAAKDDDGFWSQYSAVEAVAKGQVHRLRDPVVLRPAPRLVEGLEKVRQAVEGSSE